MPVNDIERAAREKAIQTYGTFSINRAAVVGFERGFEEGVEWFRKRILQYFHDREMFSLKSAGPDTPVNAGIRMQAKVDALREAAHWLERCGWSSGDATSVREEGL